jgi:hypothetical protein
MSGRKPECKRFLKGECNAHNCKFYHPKKKQNNHVEPQQHVPKQHVTQPTPVQEQPKKSVYEILYDRMVNGDDREWRAADRERTRAIRAKADARAQAQAQAQAQNNIEATSVAVTTIISPPPIINPVAKPGSFGSKLNSASHTTPKFDKQKFQDWLYNDMPNIDGISIISLYSQLLKVSEAETLEYCNKTNALIPDIMALLGYGLTNKKWLKELYGRFLGDSYTGIKSFSMKAVNDLLTFTLVQIYVQTSNDSDKSRLSNIENIISLYVCIMRIIGKLGIVLEIDDINTIEKKYASNKYEMFCN